MKIKVNEKYLETSEKNLFNIKEKIKPDADIVIVNGCVIRNDMLLSDGDKVVLIRRGEIPNPEELETLLTARHTPGVHEKIKKSIVGIAGLGGLGSVIAISLARLGIGKLVLADFDVVEPSNLNRQQYFIEQIGMLKTEALKNNLTKINPYIDIEIHSIKLNRENIPQIFSQVDVMVEAFDTAEAKAMIMEVFTTTYSQKPLVMASGVAGYFSSNSIITMQYAPNIYIVGDLINESMLGVGLMSPRVGIAANHQANAVLRLLLNEKVID